MHKASKNELLIFVGHSQDALAEAKLIHGMSARFQKMVKDRLAHVDNPPFTSVRVWEWNADASGRSGGQEHIVNPYLTSAHFAVFIFKERVGAETWKELDACRTLREDRPPIAAIFPAFVPHVDRMNDLAVSNEWALLQQRKRELSSGWGETESKAIRPLDDYRDHGHLGQIVFEQFDRDLESIIRRAMASHGRADEAFLLTNEPTKNIYEEIDQLSFDRRPMINYPVSNLDQITLTRLLSQPQIQRELQEAGLNGASQMQQMDYLGLTSRGRVTMGLFLCCAPRTDIIDKYSSCSLRLVVFSDIKREDAKAEINEPSGNLLSLFDQGMSFFDRGAGLTRVGLIGSSERDDLEIPQAVLREALVNALIHRDYERPETRGQPTRIEIYPDRLEISSHGNLMSGVSLLEMNEEPSKVRSIRRNEIITKVFTWSQHAELNASGIVRIHTILDRRDLPPPLIELEEDDQIVKIVIYRPFRDRNHFDQPVPLGSSGRGATKRRQGGRPTAFISSAARDLPEHLGQIRLACERAGFAPKDAIEYLSSVDPGVIDASLRMIDEADLYICVLAYRYGYVPDGYDLSITELEYNRAVEQKKPRLIFLAHDDHPVLARDIDFGPAAEKLRAFKDRIGEARIAAFFRSAGDLRAHVLEALSVLRDKLDKDEEEAREPSIRAVEQLHRKTSIPEPPNAYIAHPYTLLQSRDLVGRRAELNVLTDWVAKPGSQAFGASIFCFVAIGGMGKSALTWKWFNQIAPNEIAPFAGRMWWSFYESDATFENFLIRALCYVSGQSEDQVRGLTWVEREAQFLKHLSARPYLFALDGLERILIAYNRMDASSLADDDYDRLTANVVAGAVGLPKTAVQSFLGEHQMRRTTDPRAGALLRKLAQVSQSRILISSRLYPSELQLPTMQPRPGCFALFLKGLTDDDALGLWRGLGVTGSRAELVPIFRSVESHPLLIQALASEVAKYRDAPGDLAKWREDHPQFDPASLPLVQSRTHILEFALRGLSGTVRNVLSMIVGFRMPASYLSLESLLVGPDKSCETAKQLDQALTELEDRGLIGWDREANRYDVHPIVRGVVWQLTGSSDQSAVYAAIESHFEPMATPGHLEVESLDDLTPAIERYHTLVGLKRYQDAFALFRDKLDLATLFRLAAHRERIAWLERLFQEDATILNELEEGARSSALNALAQSYFLSGHPRQSVRVFEQAADINKRLDRDENGQTILENLADPLYETGALRKAEVAVRHALGLSRKRKDESSEASSLVTFGLMLGARGSGDSAHSALIRSWHIFEERRRFQGMGVSAAYLAEWSLWSGDFVKADSWSTRASELALDERIERDLIRAALLQGKVALGLNKLEDADERLHHSLARTRAVNLVGLELPALVALAELALLRGHPTEARAQLDDVWEAAERGPYTLQQADAYNVLAAIAIAEGNRAAAIDAATKAYKAAWCDGPPYAYHWGLQKAKEHLAALGAPEPDVPPFDASKFEPLPEVEINPKDKNWVDPDKLD